MTITGAKGSIYNPEQSATDKYDDSPDNIQAILNQQVSEVIINNLPGSFFIIDEKRRFIRWNKNHQDITGYSSEELNIMDAALIIAEEDRSAIIDLIYEGFEKGSSSSEAKILTKDGRKIPYYLTGNFIQLGQHRYLLGMGLEITRLKQTEEEIRRRNEELESIVSVSQAMRVTNSLNEFYEAILKQISDLFEVEGIAISLHDSVRQEDTVELGYGQWTDWTGKSFACNKDKNFTEVSYQQNPPVDELQSSQTWASIVRIPLIANQQLLGAIWVGRLKPIGEVDLRLMRAIGDMAANAIYRQILFEDLQIQIKMLHKTRTQLVQSEKLAAIGELVAGVAHELNNPLTSILLYARMMQQQSQNNEIDQNIEIVVRESQRAARIVRGLLDFSRQYPAEKRPVKVNEIINACLDILSFELNTHGISCNLNFDPDLPVVLADPIQLQQVFINLINNAWQAISSQKKSGLIYISTFTGPSAYFNKDGYFLNVLHIVVTNSGPRIEPENLSRIFDPFFTTKTDGKGTGLGLAISHGIITEHGGRIWAENNPNNGVDFHIELPFSRSISEVEESAPPAGAGTENLSVSQRINILVVDDEKVILDIVSRLLRKSGYNVDTSTDGNDAFILLKHKKYDVILCDMRMPGLNGPDFYERVQQIYPALTGRIIFTTGDLISAHINQFIEKSGVLYLAKPFELEQLIKLVNQVLSTTHD